MQSIILYTRLVALIFFTIFCIVLVIIFYPILAKKYWINFVKMWANGVVAIIGIKIQIIGKKTDYVEKNSMVIANHISWLDIPILYTQHSVGFIGRAEMKKWPIISLLIKSGGTIFINRERKRDLIHVNKIVSKQLINGATVGLFPEGKTSSGIHLQPFKAPLFEAPITAKSTIIPLVIKYYTKRGKPTTATTYEGDITLWQSLKSSLKLNGILVKITPLPRINAADFENREVLAEFLYNQINHYFEGDFHGNPNATHRSK